MELQHKLLIVSLCLLLCTGSAAAVAGKRPEAEGEVEALLRWKSTLLNSTSLHSWSLANPTCSWSGVSCDAGGHVTVLRLQMAGLAGTLHSLYSTVFQNLTELDLSYNNLTGAIPANISLLLMLTLLDLSSNSLTGAIPYQLSELPSIIELYLEYNSLTNPEEYAQFSPMSRLESLSLGSNGLNGTFPEFILSSTGQRLEYLDLSANAFSGQIPGSLPEFLPRLTYLDLSSNGFSGPIPRSLSRLQRLQDLILSGNNLTGGIPEDLGMISALSHLDIGKNSLGGSIPASLGKLKMMVDLDISDNGLVSTLPQELGNLTSLKYMDLSQNQLFGTLPPSFTRLGSLYSLKMSGNYLTGAIPLNCTGIRFIDLSDNLFSGSIPDELRNMAYVEQVNLAENHFDGTVPLEIGNMTTLEVLDLSNNHLEGEFLASISNLKNLICLVLAGNNFTGSISNLNSMQLPTFCQLNILTMLDLSHNHLFGELPSCIWNLPDLQIMDLSSNAFVGGNSKHVQYFFFFANHATPIQQFLHRTLSYSIEKLQKPSYSGSREQQDFRNNSFMDTGEQSSTEDSPTTIKFIQWKYSLAAFTTLQSPSARSS